jgi:undecaprenyl-diphosphatase
VDPILRGVPEAGASFPSGHAVLAFSLVALLSPYLPRKWVPLLWVLAVLNATARVYLGAHNPLDVVCGAGAGLFMGGVLTFVIGVPEGAQIGARKSVRSSGIPAPGGAS